jgi:hypothetical protein
MHTAQCDREFVMRKLGHTGYTECIQENPAFWQVTRLKDASLCFRSNLPKHMRKKKQHCVPSD